MKTQKSCTNCLPSRLNQCQNQRLKDRQSQSVTNDDGETIRDEAYRKETVQALPSFVKMSSSAFKWGADEDTAAFVANIDEAYKEVVHWRQNLFMLPSGREGQAFICELAKMFRFYGESSPLERIALKCAMILPSLILQKPHPRSRSADHVKAIHRRLQKWKNGEIIDLLQEGCTIQQRLPQRRQADDEKLENVFTSLMFRGKVRDAVRLLNKQANGAGVLSLDDQVKLGRMCTISERHSA